MEEKDLKNIAADIDYLASERNNTLILNILVSSHPADIAKIIRNLSDDNDEYVFDLLDADTASDVIVEFDDVTRDRLVSELQHERLSEIVDEMDSDDATDLVAELPEDVAEKVLESIDEEDSEEVKELLRHDEDTAGGIMALEFISVSAESTVGNAIREMRAKAEEVSEVYNVYAVDEHGVLVGFLPLKDVLLAKPRQKVRDVMVRDVIQVPVEMDQEEVTNIFRRYNLVSVPVVDGLGKLVGRITVDDIVEVMEEEASEDIQKMAGIKDEEELETSVYKISFARLPWLMVGLIGQFVSAVILLHFDASLERFALTAAFIPLMMAMGGNSGIQAATIIVRGIALGEISPRDSLQRLWREIKVSILNGVICGIVLFAVISVVGQPAFGLVLSISLIAVIINATFFGACIPMLLKTIGVDPAIATGPLITTSNDIIGIFIYLGLLTLAMQWI